jgi:carbon-monoxide dehydrogenase small subunit
LITALALLKEIPKPSRDEIRIAISGNLCRCTGYESIIKAIAAASGSMEERGAEGLQARDDE